MADLASNLSGIVFLQGLSVETMIVIKEASKEVVPLDRLDKYAFDKKLVHHNGELQIEQVCSIEFYLDDMNLHQYFSHITSQYILITTHLNLLDRQTCDWLR